MNGSEFVITSPESPNYNCIAWTANEDIRWWWPDPFGIYYWPAGVERINTVECFIHAYRTLGYEVCENQNIEEGFEKIALYADNYGVPQHAARQINESKWTSKLGNSFDIEHPFIEEWTEIICMPDFVWYNLRKYGRVKTFLKRPV